MLKRCCQQWHKLVQHSIEVRKKQEYIDARRSNEMHEWVQKRNERKKRVQPHRRLRECIKFNIENRGPLIFPESEPDDDEVQNNIALNNNTCVLYGRRGKSEKP